MLNQDLLNNLQTLLSRDVFNFLPELVACLGIVMMLLIRLFDGAKNLHMGRTALFFCLVALAVSAWQWLEPGNIARGRAERLFAGLLTYDTLTVFMRMFLFASAALLVWLTMLTGIPDREDSADFYTLLIGSTVGMTVMSSANHLLMVYIGVEMASLPSYALAGFLKGKRQSSEAALKYVVYGGGASGIMLYGISLLAGRFSTGHLPDVAAGYGEALAAGASGDPVLLLGTLFILVGLAFKLSAVPFHFWCPDVFEGASAEVAAFLSVASKGAALVLLARFLMLLGGLGEVLPPNENWLRAMAYLVPVVAFFAGLTATFGNLAAYLQTNLKRLLAYSTIAHAGYMLMGLAAVSVPLTGTGGHIAAYVPEGASAVLFYLVVYLFMNLGAFAVIAFLRNQTGSEDLSSFRGLIYRSPWMVITLAVFLLSLLGLPPLGGFPAKLQLFSALFHAGRGHAAAGQPMLSNTMYALLAIGGLNTVISAVYYLKILKVMIIDRPLEVVEGRPVTPLAEPWGNRTYAALLALAVLVLGVVWNPLVAATDEGVSRFRRAAQAPPEARMNMGPPGGAAPMGRIPGAGAPGGGGPPMGGFPGPGGPPPGPAPAKGAEGRP